MAKIPLEEQGEGDSCRRAANHITVQSSHPVLESRDIQALRAANDDQTTWSFIPFPIGWWTSC